MLKMLSAGFCQTTTRPMPFSLKTDETFRRRLKRKTPSMVGAIAKAVALLAENPAHPGLRCRRVQGTEKTWEARIDGANRLTWEYGEAGEIVLLNHCTHDEVYR